MKIAICISLFVIMSTAYRVCLAVQERKVKGIPDIGLRAIRRKSQSSYYICIVLLVSAWLFLLIAIFMLFGLLFRSDV